MIRRACAIGAVVVALLALFLILHVVHFRLLPVRVVLYDALADAVLATLLMGLLLYWRPGLRRGLQGAEPALAVLLGGVLAVLFALAVPTIIDRSLSIYILEKLAQRGGEIRLAAWDAVLKQEFMQEHRVVDIRLTEQVNSGTVRIVGDCVRLTPRGERIAWATRLYRTTLLPRQREIMGVLSDDLTDPFRRQTPQVPTACPPG